MATAGAGDDPGFGTTKETTRLEAFSDGVFAISITLLALEVRVPDSGGPLRRALLEMWPTYVAYLLSFLTILVLWLNHHALLLWVHRMRGKVLVANGMLLMLIALVPFAATLVGRYLGTADARYAVATYAGLFLAINLAFLWVWRLVVTVRHRIAPNLPSAEARSIDRWLVGGILGYAVAVGAALLHAWAGLAVAIAMVAFWLWNAYRRHHVAEHEGEGGGSAGRAVKGEA
jgi:uncharacterized membrane protein